MSPSRPGQEGGEKQQVMGERGRGENRGKAPGEGEGPQGEEAGQWRSQHKVGNPRVN